MLKNLKTGKLRKIIAAVMEKAIIDLEKAG